MSVRDKRGGMNATGDSPEGPHERVPTDLEKKVSSRQYDDVVTATPGDREVGLGKMSDTRAHADLPPGSGSIPKGGGETPKDPHANFDPAPPKR